MRSLRPVPHNPWPHDMVITVEDDSQTLLELWWIREAWQLEPVGDDLPPKLVDTPVPVETSTRSTAPLDTWQDTWPELWSACLQHAGTLRDPGVLDRLHASEVSSDDRVRLLRELVGPSWRDEVGPGALTEQAEQWMHTLYQQSRDRARPPTREQPERAALDALLPAWRSGLTKIVQIPCRGDFTRVIGSHALLLTAETRADPVRYREALAAFH